MPRGEPELRYTGPPITLTPNVALSRWTRFCWWLSRRLGGRKVFGKQDLT